MYDDILYCNFIVVLKEKKSISMKKEPTIMTPSGFRCSLNNCIISVLHGYMQIILSYCDNPGIWPCCRAFSSHDSNRIRLIKKMKRERNQLKPFTLIIKKQNKNFCSYCGICEGNLGSATRGYISCFAELPSLSMQLNKL